MTTASDNSDDDRSISFVVTGFGPFRDSLENPTTIIADELVEYLKSKNETDLANCTTTRVIETSAQAAREQVDDMMKQNSNNNTTVYLHLGVNYKGAHFQLEQCAYNDATFRIPDERGHQPRNQCIVEENAIGSSLTTTLDLDGMCQQLESGVCPVVVSMDPGRFVCNYTYYCSLNKTQDEPRVYSLFVHVPPFRVAPKEEQLKVIVQIMKCIDKQLAANTVVNEQTN